MIGRAGGRMTGRGGEAEPRPMQRPVQRPVAVKSSFSNRFSTRLLPIKFQFKETQINTNWNLM
jgi:hypothetical protein